MNSQNLRGLTWLLPVSVAVLVAYIAGAIAAGRLLDTPIWLLVILAFFPIVISCGAMVVALMDCSFRPKGEITDEAKLAWIVALVIFNVFALLPYWIAVVRRRRPATA